MPFYEFKCKACLKRFTVKQSFTEHDRHVKVKCTKCGTQEVQQVVALASVVTSKKS